MKTATKPAIKDAGAGPIRHLTDSSQHHAIAKAKAL